MSSPSTLPIPYRTITPTQIQSCVTLYPTVLERVYKVTRPRSNLEELLEDDRWRYEVLPKQVADEGGRALRKEELQRLVKWKITHGTYRPFLPSMVAKNTPEAVTNATTLSIRPIHELDVTAAHVRNTYWPSLTQICKLQGVGPATGSLVLSVYSPKYVPFFADELFHWIDMGNDTASKDKGKRKLKYDLKEYDVVLAGVGVLSEQSGGAIEAKDIERVGYVMGHLDVLSKEKKEKILGVAMDTGPVKSGKEESRGQLEEEAKSKVEGEDEAGKAVRNDTKEQNQKLNAKSSKAKNAKAAPKREASDVPLDSSGTRRSKRTKK